MISSTRILVVFTSTVVRRLIERYLVTEFEDADVQGCSGLAEAAPLIRAQSIDVIVCEFDASDDEAIDLYRLVRGSARNRDTPLVYILPASQDRARCPREDNVAQLVAPFSSAQLSDTILQVFNARRKRRAQRHHVPGARAVLVGPGRTVEGPVINLSMQAVLLELSCAPGILPELLGADLELHLPGGGDAVSIAGIQARLLRLHIVGWEGEDVPTRVRGVWLFRRLDDAAADRLSTELMRIQDDNNRAAQALQAAASERLA